MITDQKAKMRNLYTKETVFCIKKMNLQKRLGNNNNTTPCSVIIQNVNIITHLIE